MKFIRLVLLKIYLPIFSAPPEILNCADELKYAIGNGHCNDETNNPACNYDHGDCCLSNPNTDHCSECLCATTGVVTSPGFPRKYGDSLDVSWLIQVPHGQLIEITFISFDVDPWSSCM